MQYAHILIDRPRVKLLTYKINPSQLSQLKLNILVKVPLGSTEVWGIVFKLVKTVSNLNPTNLKTISHIYPEIQFSKNNLFFANWLRNEYLASISESLFIQIPLNLPKKIDDIKLTFPEIEPNQQIRNEILIKYNERLSTISDLVTKFIKSGKSIRIIIPDLSELNSIESYLTLFKPLKLNAKDSAKKRIKIIQEYYQNDQKTIIGGRNLGLLPPKKDELWIIDDPDNFSYKSDQTPKFHLNTLLHYWSNYVSIVTINTIPFLLSSYRPVKFLKTSKNIPFDAPIIIKKEEKILQNLNFYDQKNILVVLPQMSLKESLFCFKCYHSAISPCCGSNLLIKNQKWQCQNCCNIYNNLNCIDCGNPYSLSSGSKYDQINKSNFSYLKFIHLNEINAYKLNSKIIMLGFDYYLDNPSIYSVVDYIKTVARLSQVCDELLIFTQLNTNKIFGLLNNSKIEDLEQYLYNYTNKLKTKPYYRIVTISLPKHNSKYLNEIEQWLKSHKLKKLIDFSGPNLSLDGYNFYINVPTKNWKMFCNSWQTELPANLLNSIRVDIDPYRVV